MAHDAAPVTARFQASDRLLPEAGSHAIALECRVVYVDYDPVVLAHARALLVSYEAGAINYVDADLRDTGKILAEASQLLDAVPPGSYLAPTHMGSDLLDEETQDDLEGMREP